MKIFKYHLCIGFVIGCFLVAASASDPSLQEAIRKGNEGDVSGAIADLELLKRSMPEDAQVHLSLGLLYQSVDRVDDSITELEKATNLSPSPDAAYTLALLYESKINFQPTHDWKEKAVAQWEAFLSKVSTSHPRVAVAQKHLRHLQEKGE